MNKHILITTMMLILFIQPFTALAFLGDADEDGVPEIVLNNGRNTDNCPDLFNPDQRDGDNDGLGDTCDPLPEEPAPEGTDVDRDGVPDGEDNCPLVPNRDQANVDRDEMGDACDADNDNDSVPDNRDNCPRAANPGQENLDRDNEGNACDNDDDGDGRPDAQDECPLGNGAQSAPECRDNGVPTITLRNPENGEVMRSSTIDFNFVVADNFDVRLDCEMFSDIQGDGAMRSMHILRGLNIIFDFFTGFTSNTFTVQNIPDGQYRWFAACTDDNGNRGVSETATFTIVTRDVTAPTVTLVFPRDNSATDNPSVSFMFRTRDNVPGPQQCQLFTDIAGNFGPRGNPLRLAANQNGGVIQVNNIPPGDYIWNVQCTDAAGNTGSAPFKFSFTINPPVPPVNQCANGAQDAGEEGIDCGGVCANACPVVPPVEPVPPAVPPAVVSQTNVPDVRLDAEIHNEAAPARVTFTTEVSGGNGPFRFVWDFNDGTVVETAANVAEHIFEKAGRFDVSVRVFDRDGDRTTASIRIRIHSGVLDGERDVRLGSVVFESPHGYGEAVPGDQLMIAVGMTNTGVETMRNLKLTVLSYDLALHQRLVLNSIAAGETATKRMMVDVPPDTPPGEYLVQVSLTDENQLNKVTYHPLIVQVY